MNLIDVVHRPLPPEPWSEGEKIPWDEPEFSGRMLLEHLSQAHDRASRRDETISAHVDWIHRVALEREPARILDLGCGPGLYMARLAALGHECVGIDFSPITIEHAAATASEAGLRCTYRLADIRTTDYGHGFDLAMLTFGEFNVFRPPDARAILSKTREALVDGGLFLLEVHSVEAVRNMGMAPATWRAAESGLFSDRPHLRLDERFWDEDQRVATERWYVIDAETAAVTRFAQSVQAYTDHELYSLLRDSGFELRGVYPSLSGMASSDELFVLLGVAI